MGIHLIQIGGLPQSKAIKTFKAGVMHIFLNFLTLSVILCCLFVSVSMSEAVQLSQWQLVIHFSSTIRSVPCILIRANSLDTSEFKALIRSAAWLHSNLSLLWKLLLQSSFHAQTHSIPPPSSFYLSLMWTHMCTHISCRKYTYYSFVPREFARHVIVHEVESVKYKNSQGTRESKGRVSA